MLKLNIITNFMDQIIRINDLTLQNDNYFGLIFWSNSNIKKYFNDNDINKTLEKEKSDMMIIPSKYNINKYCDVQLYEKTKIFLNGSVGLEITYKKVMDDTKDVTNMLYDRILLIINIPILK